MSQQQQDGDDDGWATVPSKKKSNGGNHRRNNNNNKNIPHPDWASPLPAVEPIPPTPQNNAFQPFLLLLMGLPGSGKSTLAQALETAMSYKFVRINQDLLKSRKKCESRLRTVLGIAGQNNTTRNNNNTILCPMMDRCNFDATQRQHWYNIAQEYETISGKKLPVDVVILDVPASECLRRCSARQNHETITTTSQARSVIAQMQRQWEVPSVHEQKQHLRSCTVVKNSNQYQDVLVQLLNQTG